MLQQGNLEEALAEIDRVVSIFGQSVEALELQVEIRGAIVAKNRSPEEEAQIWLDRGNQFYDASDFENAIISCDKAIEFKHDSHAAWYNRGCSLARLGYDDEAIASYDKAIDFKHDFHEAWNGRSASLANLCRYEEALDSYDEASKSKNNKHEVLHNRGSLLEKIGRL
ncbi:MAG: tetratricopeptide repeat protein [Alkalinema sp. RU_4_3]|nr:tetratricopeptide repeat protein [Alkalinema sp. RU_4_3]